LGIGYAGFLTFLTFLYFNIIICQGLNVKKIGLIGGMSFESTITYYKNINQMVAKQLGGLHSANLVLYSVDFSEIAAAQHMNDWDKTADILMKASKALKNAGCDGVMICTNTMHKLATQFTMTHDFYTGYLEKNYDIQVVVPDEIDRVSVHQIIYDELCLGIILDSSRNIYKKVMQKMVDAGCESIILGCTEIGLLIEQSHCGVPVLDTTTLHSQMAADWMLS
jgi:aspartate racemase